MSSFLFAEKGARDCTHVIINTVELNGSVTMARVKPTVAPRRMNEN